jgi:phosphopantothenate synthetase
MPRQKPCRMLERQCQEMRSPGRYDVDFDILAPVVDAHDRTRETSRPGSRRSQIPQRPSAESPETTSQFHIDECARAISIMVQAVERVEECHRRITQRSRNPRLQTATELMNRIDARGR